MKIKFSEKIIDYDGGQLRNHWIFDEFGLLGDAAAVFIGAAEVSRNLVDLIDKKNNDFIYGPKMLHFIIEHFGATLPEIVLRQQGLVYLAAGEINRLKGRVVATSRGNDIFYQDKKLSVSIATVSPVSGLIHLGLNISLNKKVPVRAACLNEIKISPQLLAKNILKKYAQDFQNFKKSLVKVRGVA